MLQPLVSSQNILVKFLLSITLSIKLLHLMVSSGCLTWCCIKTPHFTALHTTPPPTISTWHSPAASTAEASWLWLIGWLLCVGMVVPVLCSAWYGLATTFHCRMSWLYTSSSSNLAWWCHLTNLYGVSAFCLCVMFPQEVCLSATDDAVQMHCVNVSYECTVLMCHADMLSRGCHGCGKLINHEFTSLC